MNNYKYLIVGGGMTAHAAVKGIREVDADGSIGMIGSEPYPPYKRPPLSKKLWQGKPEDSIWLHTENCGVRMHLMTRVERIDPENKYAVDNQGEEYTYDKLLLATGGTPRRLLFTCEELIYYRTLDDYHELRALTERGNRFAVIGGGFIGSEIAAALAMNGKEVVMIFPENGIGDRIFPRDLSEFLAGYYRDKGVEVLAADTAMELEAKGDGYVLATGSEREIKVHAAVAGIGIVPNTQLADAAGITLGNGIRVDLFCCTSQPDVYAAGDVAEFLNPLVGMRMRVEHEDNALTMGECAGMNMAGLAEPYEHLPYFYSDLFDLGYEAVGQTDSRLETFSDWKEPYQEGVIYYLSEGRVVGAVLWNVWDKVPAARKLFAEPGPFTPDDLRGRIA